MKTSERRKDGKTVRLLLTIGLCTALPPVRLAAQASPAVRSAVQLAAEGRADSARHLLDGALRHARTGDSAWVEALYWRARLAPGGESAERDLRRIVVEHGNSAWADDALLQLAQLALAGGNPAAAMEFGDRLRADYPGSELRPRAALWAGRAAFDVGETRAGCALLDSARSEGAADVEFVNQVSFYRGRCTASALARPPVRRADSTGAPRVATPARDSLVPIHGAAAPPPAPRVAPARFEVQVAAPRSQAAARDLVRRLARSRMTARVVPASGVYRVRLGPYESQVAADSAIARARRIVGGRPFLVRLP